MNAKHYKEIKISSWTSMKESAGLANNFSLYDTFTANWTNINAFIASIRSVEYGSVEYKNLKKSLPLPMCMISGLSRKSHSIDNIIKVNPFLCFDIDKNDNKDIDLEQLYFDLFDLPCTLCVGKSLSGLGIFGIIVLPDDVNKVNYVRYWNAFTNRLYKNNIINDKQTNDISRLRYISVKDEMLWKDDNAEIVPFNIQEDTCILNGQTTITNDGIHFTLNKLENGNVDFKYYERWNVANTLWAIYKDIEQCKNIIRQISPQEKWDDFYSVLNTASKNNKSATTYGKEILKLYGYNFDDENDGSKIITLNENEYLGDIKDNLLDMFVDGFNLLIAGTGVGKTELWKKIANENKQRVLVIEPLNAIINNKYDESFYKAIGNTYISNDVDVALCSYNKFNSLCSMIFDAKKKMPHTEYDIIVVDESHMLGLSEYRAEIIIPFINNLKRYNETYGTKIVLQTATISNEEYYFNISKIIEVKKDTKKTVDIEFSYNNVFDDYDTDKESNECCAVYSNSNVIHQIYHYTEKYINEGRKVYVYWGVGSIDKMKHYEECECLMNRYKVAIFHKKNTGSEDMEYINNEHKIGKYDVLISSCYFGVGCDLNDEDKTAVIIVGNNPYQEDEQAIGRFRNSKDIKVNILLDNLYVEKIDVSEQLINENEISSRVNKSLSQREKSIVRRKYGEDYNYMLCAKYYFSDIERKFKFFIDRKYNVLNRYELIYNEYRKRYEYEIQDINGQCIINLLDDVEVLDTIVKNRKRKLIEKKHVIYEQLLNGEDIDLYELRENNVASPKFHDFLDALLVIKNYYNLQRFLRDVSKKSFMKLSKDKMNTLLAFKMKIDSNKVDRIELDLVKKLCSVENKSSLQYYYPLFYCYWCMYADEKNNNVYDMMNYDRLNYPLFNQWRKTFADIIEVNSEIRDYILNYEDENICTLTDYFFGLDELKMNDFEEDYKIFKNKYINKGHYMTFLNYCYNNKKHKTRDKTIEIDGIVYASVTDAARKLNISRQSLYKRLSHNK